MYRQMLSQAALELNSRTADVQVAQTQIDARAGALESIQAPLEMKQHQHTVAEQEHKQCRHKVCPPVLFHDCLHGNGEGICSSMCMY